MKERVVRTLLREILYHYFSISNQHNNIQHIALATFELDKPRIAQN